ncbi:MAG TPA: ATP-binding protein [Verrucomicrobiae bacterium]|nr:ATP-binding protein [Verrucomicrobiae bacterium]
MKEPVSNRVIPFPVKLLTGALALSGLLLIGLVWSAYEAYRKVDTDQLRDLRIAELRGTIVHLDEVLTMSARMAAATGDLSWEQRYRQFEPQLDAAVKEAIQLTSGSGSAEAATKTEAANLKLIEMENRSFELVRNSRADEAKAVLFSEAYETQKNIYAHGMVEFIDQLKAQLAASQQQMRRRAIFSIAIAASSIILLFFTWLTVVGRLNQWRTSQLTNFSRLASAEEELRKAHVFLERRVEERTKELHAANAELSAEIVSREEAQEELKATHKELLIASRQAGMAEVATGVLHNVGNVLNSVNVSATLVTDNMKRSKVGNLGKAVALLQSHSADLGTFLSGDPKGKQLPGYLAQLTEHLAKEQQNVIAELESLRKNIEHIKDIVALQQNYAKLSGVAETVKVIDLIEDSLRMNSGALTRHEVQVVREFGNPLPEIIVDRHKVLQILVNLVRNAKYACDESGRNDKRMILRAFNGDGRIKISVADNGVGIPKENLTRIFNHGFTTRKDGHGFGLHSGALAAREMGGSLNVHSEGPGLGACFTIDLPVQHIRTNT